MKRDRRITSTVAIATVVLVAASVVIVGRSQSNPPVVTYSTTITIAEIPPQIAKPPTPTPMQGLYETVVFEYVLEEPKPESVEEFAPPKPPFTERELEMLAQTVWGEARGCTPDEQRLVVWTVFQRVDADRWGNSIEAVITAPWQFVGFYENHPIYPEKLELVREEAMRWWNGEQPPLLYPFATSLPYFYFDGDGRNNWFREVWRP